MTTMQVDDSLVIGAFAILSGAIATLAGAIAFLWMHFDKKLMKLEKDFILAIKGKCVNGATEPRWCQKHLHRLLPQTDKTEKTALEKSHAA
jgi:hypothetical protein